MANPSTEFVESYSLPLELPLSVHVDKWWYVVNTWSTCDEERLRDLGLFSLVCWTLILTTENLKKIFTPSLTDINLSWFIETQDLEKYTFLSQQKNVKFNAYYAVKLTLPSQFIDLFPCRSTKQQ